MNDENWTLVVDELPPLGLPVWTWERETDTVRVGGREWVDESGGEWCWCNSYGDFWWDGEWKALWEADDFNPTAWKYLPTPPNIKSQMQQ